MYRLSLLASLILVSSLSAQGQNPAILLTESPLLNGPKQNSQVVGLIPQQSQVDVKMRKGLWANIEFEGVDGWVKVTSLRFSSSNQTSTNLSNLNTGRSGAGNGVAVTGVRGLDAEEISLAEPSQSELESFLSTNISADLMASFETNERVELNPIQFQSQNFETSQSRSEEKKDRDKIPRKDRQRRQIEDDF